MMFPLFAEVFVREPERRADLSSMVAVKAKSAGRQDDLSRVCVDWPVSARDAIIDAMTTPSVQRLGVPFVQGEC
ncbi:hypothetical protein ABTW96_21645 [Nocardia beijingensis]|uniref:hypothetical protein n=1 Tax=Nocardia beijingensis TaxID=95162 RepID=UPI0033283A80